MCYSNIIRFFPPENVQTKCFVCYSNCGSTALFSLLSHSPVLFISFSCSLQYLESLAFLWSNIIVCVWHSSELLAIWNACSCLYLQWNIRSQTRSRFAPDNLLMWIYMYKYTTHEMVVGVFHCTALLISIHI